MPLALSLLFFFVIWTTGHLEVLHSYYLFFLLFKGLLFYCRGSVFLLIGSSTIKLSESRPLVYLSLLVTLWKLKDTIIRSMVDKNDSVCLFQGGNKNHFRFPLLFPCSYPILLVDKLPLKWKVVKEFFRNIATLLILSYKEVWQTGLN